MGKDITHGLMEESITVIMIQIKNKGGVHMFGQMAKDSKAIGLTDNKTEKELSQTRKVKLEKASGKMVNVKIG